MLINSDFLEIKNFFKRLKGIILKFRNNIYFELIVFKVAFSCQINICIIYYKVLKLDN